MQKKSLSKCYVLLLTWFYLLARLRKELEMHKEGQLEHLREELSSEIQVGGFYLNYSIYFFPFLA